MAVVPILPTRNAPQKPDVTKVVDGVGLVLGMLLGEGNGIPKDAAGHLTPQIAPAGGEWVDTPWGRGYKITGNPLILGQYTVNPPATYHVLFKPTMPNPETLKDALVFGEVGLNQRPANGLVFEWVTAVDTEFAAFAADGDPLFSYIPIQPQENEWIAITVTYDGSEVLFYINGMYTLEEAEHASTPIANRTWVIGGPGFNGGGFNGIVADARIYNRVLSPGEIAQITSGPLMWEHYGAEPTTIHGHQWRRRVWSTAQGNFRIGRRVAKIRR